MIRFVDYKEDFLEKSWLWLNDAEIKYLTNTPNFSKEEQKKWYESLKSRKDYIIYGITFNNKLIGACGLKNITHIDAEYWGYIGEKKYWGMGFGIAILDEMIHKAKGLRLVKLWLKVIKDNERAIGLYKKKNFAIKKEFGNEYIMELIL